MVESKQAGIRFSPELLARLEAYTQRLAVQSPGMRITLSDAVRVLLTKALDAEGIKAEKGRAKR